MRPAGVNTHPAESTSTTVLVVASGKGGTGTSVTAALLALAVAGEGRQVLLVDGTENYGALHLMLGVTPRHPLAALRGGEVDVEDLLTPVDESLSLFPGGADDALAASPLTHTERTLLFRRVHELHERFDLVVIDAGSRMEAVVTACAGGVTRLLLVVTDEQIAMAASHALLKSVELHRPGLPVDVVANRCDDGEGAMVHGHLLAGAERFLQRGVGYAGAVPADGCLQGGLGAGMTIQDAAAGSPAAIAARTVGLRMLDDAGVLIRRELAAGGRVLARHA